MTTQEIVQEFVSLVDTDIEYSLSEIKNILSGVYKTFKNPSKAPAKKRVVKKDTDDEDVASGNDSPKKRGRPCKIKLNKDGTVKKKKAPSAYNLFIREKYAELKPLHEDLKAPQIMKIAAAVWKELTEDEKKSFKLSVQPEEEKVDEVDDVDEEKEEDEVRE